MSRYRKIIQRLRQYANQHERPPYGRAIEGEEDLERQAADAIEQLLAEIERLTSNNRVETPLGALIARPVGVGGEYPGIWIDLRRPDADHDLGLALVEYTGSEADLEDYGHIITRVWGDDGDEYTDRIVHTHIEEYFKTEEIK